MTTTTRKGQMHLDDEQVQRVLHGEVLTEEESAIVGHLSRCDSCNHRIERARREEGEILELLGTVDHAHRQIDIEIVRRAARPKALPFQQFRWAAGVVAAVGVTALAYAMPASPFKRWIDDLLRPAPAQAPHAPESSKQESSDVGGVSIEPGSGVRLLFTAAQETGEARVVLRDVEEVSVRAPGGSVRFAVSPGRLTIENPGASVDYEIIIPRSAPRVEIQLAGVRIWAKNGERVVSEYPGAPDGVTHLPLRGPGEGRPSAR